jgi:hypothetical protein
MRPDRSRRTGRRWHRVSARSHGRAPRRTPPGRAQRHVLPEPQLGARRRVGCRDPGVVGGQRLAGVPGRKPLGGQLTARPSEGRPGEIRHRSTAARVESRVARSRRADRPVDAPVRIADVDQGEPLHFPRRGPHGHHGGTRESLPLPVAVLELDRNAMRVMSEGPQRISTRTFHGGRPLLIDENGDSGLQQGVEGNSLSLPVVVIPHECVVTQENRSEPVQISRNPVRGNTQRRRPRLRLPVIPGSREERLELPDVTDARPACASVQPGRVPLLQTAAHGLRPERLVVPQAAPLVEERRERRNSPGHRPYQRQRRTSITSTERQYEYEQDGDPANRRFPGPVHKCAKCHHRSPRRFSPCASCY